MPEVSSPIPPETPAGEVPAPPDRETPRPDTLTGEPVEPSTTDWPTQATDSIVRVVDSVRDKTAGPAITATKVLIYGTAIALLAIPLAVWSLIIVMRITERVIARIGAYFGWDFLREPMWLVYYLYGALFALVGLWCWRKAKRAPAAAATRH